MRCEGPDCSILQPSAAATVVDEEDCLCRLALQWIERRQRSLVECFGCLLPFPQVGMVRLVGPGGCLVALCKWCYQGAWPLARRRRCVWWDGNEWVPLTPW